MCEFLDFFDTISLQGVHAISKYDVSSSKSSIHSLHARPTSKGFSGILNGSIFSDFPTLSTFTSVGFGACPSAPCWPSVSGMISYRVRGLFASSFRRFLLSFLLLSSKFPVV